MTRRSSCTKADIERLIKAAIAAGVGREHVVITVNRDGATMRFSDKPVEDAKPAAVDDASWSDVDAA